MPLSTQSARRNVHPHASAIVGSPAWRWTIVLGLYLASAGMIAIAVSMWRTVDAATAQAVDEAERLEHFHSKLVDSINNLAEQAGILTSADLSLIRFRLRAADGSMAISTIREAKLEVQRDDGAWKMTGRGMLTGSQRLDFGLMPPARYRLTLLNRDRMRHVSEFNHLPGVPIDRFVPCPASLDIGQLGVPVHLDLGEEFARPDLVALVDVVPTDYSVNQTIWEVNPDWPTKTVLAGLCPETCGRLKEISHPVLDQLLEVEQVWPLGDPSELPRPRVDLWSIPYRRSEVRGVSLYRHTTEAGVDRLTHVADLRFGADLPRFAQSGPAFEASTPVQTPEVRIGHTTTWSLPLPDAIRQQLLERLRQVAPVEVDGDSRLSQRLDDREATKESLSASESVNAPHSYASLPVPFLPDAPTEARK